MAGYFCGSVNTAGQKLHPETGKANLMEAQLPTTWHDFWQGHGYVYDLQP